MTRRLLQAMVRETMKPALASKNILTCLGSAIVFTSGALAAPLATDSFATTSNGAGGTYSTANGTDGRIYGQNPTASNSGFDTAWQNTSNGNTSAIRVELTGLNHSLLQGSAVAGDSYGSKGNALRVVSRGLDSTVDSNIAAQEAAGGDLWFSSLTTVGEIKSGGSFLGLSANGSHDTVPTTGIQFYTGSGQIRLWNGATEIGTRVNITTGVTYLIAVKIDFTAGGTGNDTVTVEIYSPTATAGTPTATITASGLTLSASDLGYLTMYQANTLAYTSDSTTPRFDEFRLGLTRGDVMAIPEPTSVAMLGLGLGTMLIGWPRRRRTA